MHLGSTLAYCALISSLYCGKSTIMHFIFSQLGVIVELYSYLCILAVDRSNVSCLSFCLRMLVRSAVCTVYWYIYQMEFFVIHISVYVDIGYLFVDAHLKINTFYTFVMLGFMDTFMAFETHFWNKSCIIFGQNNIFASFLYLTFYWRLTV